jgi:hypothetical protein
MTEDRPKDIVSGRTTLHLEPFTQIFGATMGRSVYTRRRRCSEQDKVTNVAVLITLCRLGIDLARVATNPGTGKQRRAEEGGTVSELVSWESIVRAYLSQTLKGGYAYLSRA